MIRSSAHADKKGVHDRTYRDTGCSSCRTGGLLNGSQNVRDCAICADNWVAKDGVKVCVPDYSACFAHRRKRDGMSALCRHVD